MADYRKLQVWQSARTLAAEVYRHTASYPSDERFGLISQTQRAAVSVAANIAEGCGRGSDRDFCRFVRMAIGSLNELDTLLAIAEDVGHASVPRSIGEDIRDLAVRLRNLAQRLESSTVREDIAAYDPTGPSTAIVGDRPQP